MQGIGVDIIKISRMAEIVQRSGELFLKRVFTNAEREAGREHHDPAAYYAATFAAKEAVFKLFSIGWDSGVDMQEIEVHRGQHGVPQVELNGRFAQLANKHADARVLLSLSYDGDTAIAVAALVHG